VSAEKLSECEVKFANDYACCVVLASNGYPQKYETGFPITLPQNADGDIFVAGAKLVDGKVVTGGGRVLGVVAVSDNLESAVNKAYENVKYVTFDNAFYRKDIGLRALNIIKEK
jgi:phosphoribosylamine--glycine ligase